MNKRNVDESDEERPRLPAWVGKLRALLSAPLPDPSWESNPQQAEEWALMEFARLREELRQEGLARRRSFIQGQVCARIADGHTRAAAARLSGVTPETVGRWLRKDADFAAAVRDVECARAPAARPHWGLKMTDSLQETLVGLLREGMTRRDATAAAGVSRQTFYTWFNGRLEFRDAVLAAEASSRVAETKNSRRRGKA